MKEKFDRQKAKVEKAKEDAAAEFKKGCYAEAINLYKKAADILANCAEYFTPYKKELAQMEAAVFGNIAFCYSKDQ